MPVLENSRHEKFAQAVANGANASEAYRQVSAKRAWKRADAHAYEWMRNSGISERIAELKQRTEAKADITRAEIIKILAGYARSHPGDYPHDTRLRAIQQLTKMTGWDAPDKVELSADNELTELLKRLRGGG